MKVLAIGPRYVLNAWRNLELVIIVVSVADIIVEASVFDRTSTVVAGLQCLRVLRVFRLWRRIPRLYHMFQAFVLTIPGAFNVVGLLLLLLYVYAVIGMQLFAPVQLQSNLDSRANYQSFSSAMLTLFRACVPCSTV